MAVGRFLCNEFDLSYGICYTRKLHPTFSGPSNLCLRSLRTWTQEMSLGASSIRPDHAIPQPSSFSGARSNDSLKVALRALKVLLKNNSLCFMKMTETFRSIIS